MMLKGIDLSQRVEFSCKEDKDNPTIFILRPLSGIEMMNMSQFMEGKVLKISGDYVISLLEKTIVEIKNPDIKGEDVKEFVKSLSPIIIMEIMSEVGKINNITESEEKN